MVCYQFYPRLGGAEKQARLLARTLIGKGVDVKVVTGWLDRCVPQRENIDCIAIYRNFTLWNGLDIKGLRRLGGVYLYMLTLGWHLIRHREEYDIVHIHQALYPAFVGVTLGHRLGKKTVVKVGNSGDRFDLKYLSESQWDGRWMAQRIRGTDRVVATCQQIERELIEYGFDPGQIVRIPNGVQLGPLGEESSSDGRKSREALRLSSDNMLVTFVGSMNNQKKGVDVLLRAWARVEAVRQDCDLMLLGDGPLRPSYERLAQELGIHSRVHFPGETLRVEGYLAASDVFVLPSRAEGMSNALLEAMAAGLPCVATEVGGNVDLIEDNVNGLLVPANDHEALAAALLRLISSEGERTVFGRRARQVVERDYDIEDVAERYMQVYLAL